MGMRGFLVKANPAYNSLEGKRLRGKGGSLRREHKIKYSFRPGRQLS